MLNSELIDSVLKDAAGIPPIADKFKTISKDTLNYKPSGGWSAAECFEHLVLIDKKYIPIFTDISGSYSETEDKEFKNSFLGKTIIKSVHPDNPKKVKTRQPFYPVSSIMDQGIVNEFLQLNSEIVKFIKRFRNYDLKKINITSPLSSFVKYNLGDACRIIIYHDLRHLKQAQRAADAYPG